MHIVFRCKDVEGNVSIVVYSCNVYGEYMEILIDCNSVLSELEWDHAWFSLSSAIHTQQGYFIFDC